MKKISLGKIYIIILLLASLSFGYFLYGGVSKNMTPDLFEKLILPTIFATFATGFIAYNLDKTKFHFLQEDFLIVSLLQTILLLTGIYYYLAPTNNYVVFMGKIIAILFISSLVYYALIIIYSIAISLNIINFPKKR